MEIGSMSKDELVKLQLIIGNRMDEIHEKELLEKVERIKPYLDKLRSNKDLILSLVKHSRTSCSDENPSNGWGSASYGARCTKCHLIDILDNDWDDFEVSLDVTITKIQ